MIICKSENLNLPLVNCLQHFNPLGQLRPPVHDDLIPHLCLLLDALAIPKPADVCEVSRDGVELLEPLSWSWHPTLVNQSQCNAAFAQHLNELWDKPTLVSDFYGELVIFRQFLQEWFFRHRAWPIDS